MAQLLPQLAELGLRDRRTGKIGFLTLRGGRRWPIAWPLGIDEPLVEPSHLVNPHRWMPPYRGGEHGKCSVGNRCRAVALHGPACELQLRRLTKRPGSLLPEPVPMLRVFKGLNNYLHVVVVPDDSRTIRAKLDPRNLVVVQQGQILPAHVQ